MFLVSNEQMVVAALDNGITAAFPALNYRTIEELRHVITQIKNKTQRPFGVNLIVNKSNSKYHEQLQVCLDLNVSFIITSLGNPSEVIEKCKPKAIKVFCDVIDLAHALKVEALGADAVVAVNADAGGHAGNLPAEELIPLLKSHLKIPVISAGGIANSQKLKATLKLGAAGVSIGTLFIASTEANVSAEYQQALITYGAKDIVLSTRLSGTPCTVINTPFYQSLEASEKGSMGAMLTQMNTPSGGNYKNLWCAGKAIEEIHSIRPIREIIHDLVKDF